MLKDLCESASISKVYFPLSDSEWPRTIDVTVLPTPPRKPQRNYPAAIPVRNENPNLSLTNYAIYGIF